MGLREYIEIFFKRKNVVAAVFFISLLIGGMWSKIATKFFEVSMVIEPPIIGTENGIQGYDSVENIKARIESGAYNTKILKELNIPWKGIRFSVVQPKNTRLIRVSMQRAANQAEAGARILGKLVDELNFSYEKFLSDKRNRVENEIKMVSIQINTKENEIKLKNEQYKLLVDRERQLLDEIKSTKANSDKLIDKRDPLFQKREGKDDISVLLYTATIQQNIAYFNQLQNEFFSLKANKESTLTEIENIKTSINQARIQIGNLNMSKGGIQNISVIQEPLIALAPSNPGSRQIVFFFGICGLVFGIFCALFVEYWKRSQPFSAPTPKRAVLTEVY